MSTAFRKRRLQRPATSIQRAAEAREKITVAANEFVIEEEPPQTLYIGDVVGKRQCEKLKSLRHRRDNHAVRKALDALKHAASADARRRERADR